MTGLVTGKLPANRNTSAELKEQLQNLGYDFKQDSMNYEFSKEAALEETISEVEPICQSLGWNAKEDLTLIETYEDLAMRSIYENGRIVREFQRGS